MTPHDPFADGLPDGGPEGAHDDDSREGRLAVGWALHALEPDEELEFSAHRPGCAVCERLVAETSEVLGALGEAVPEEEPPSGLRDAILAAAGEEPAPPGRSPRPADRDDGPPTGPIYDTSLPPMADPMVPAPTVMPRPARPAPRGTDPSRSEPTRPARDRRRTDRPRDRSRHSWVTGRPWSARSSSARSSSARRRWVTRGVAAVAALAAVVAIGALVVTNDTLRTQRDEQAVAAVAASARASAASAGAASSSQVLRVMADAGAPGASHATLAAPSGALVGLVTNSGRGPEVVTTGLAANRSDQTYVLWGLASATSKPVGLAAFDVSGSAPSARSVGSVPGSTFAGYAVSLEPGRTVPAVPTQVVASGQVSG